ncbi:MAG: copper oxidase [Deltaproteobacteria bacterium]|nr:copper oxidase [Deltaproteobacteria bacterium]
MRFPSFLFITLLVILVRSVSAQPAAQESVAKDSEHAHHQHHVASHEHHGMQMDAGGMVMNENHDQQPRDCGAIAGEQKITVRAGTTYAQRFNGTIFAYDQHEWNIPPCTKVTVTLENEDSVRHQWMLHGLPRYLHPEGMFHLEVNGRGSKTGTFITPGAKKTYLVHCDVAQHMEKGMKAQLKVGGGDGNLPSIPGITAARYPETYANSSRKWAIVSASIVVLIAIELVLRLFWRKDMKNL